MGVEIHLTLKQLRAFAAVFRRRKLAAAAEELGISQSAVSVLIRQAEETLGTRLFDRTTRSLVPTPAAEDAFGVAERILQDVQTLSSNFRDLSEGERGRVRIAATPATAAAFLPRTARRFSHRYANVGLVINDCAPNQFLQHIEAERVDFGLGTPPPEGTEFASRVVHEDNIALVCARDHPFARRDSVRWAELAGETLIVFRPGYGVRQLIESTLLKTGIDSAITHEVGFLATAAWMAASSLGVTILPRALAHLEARSDLAIVPLVEPALTRTIALITKKGRSLSPPCRLFSEMLIEDMERL